MILEFYILNSLDYELKEFNNFNKLKVLYMLCVKVIFSIMCCITLYLHICLMYNIKSNMYMLYKGL